MAARAGSSTAGRRKWSGGDGASRQDQVRLLRLWHGHRLGRLAPSRQPGGRQHQLAVLSSPGRGGRGGQVRLRVRRRHRLHDRQVAFALAQHLRADLHPLGPGGGDPPHRPGGDRLVHLHQPLQLRSAAGIPRPDQRRARRLERGHLLPRRQRRQLRPGRTSRTRHPLPHGRRAYRRRPGPLGFLGGRRPHRRQGDRRVHGQQQAAYPQPRGRVLPGEGPPQHRPVRTGPAGDLPGRRVRGRRRLRRAPRRRRVRQARQPRAGQRLLPGRQGARRRGRARSGHVEDLSQHPPDRRPRRGPRRAALSGVRRSGVVRDGPAGHGAGVQRLRLHRL